ncbi:protein TRIGALACTOSYLDIACYLGLYCEROL 4, chloroplastic-like [Dorcoceras hygrometricum]|uniref:Protein TRIGALACTOSYLDIACYLGLYCEROL 4, chloroplastic-like n=1 Tax=Dorcoceras hygrometricum TaxID=472368 RepID=A0A2Z7C3R3_9LAMI|nr:protein TRIGALACTOSYLDIACYLGLYCEROL 4, chloroplastic-like [Dorcoceras hygrometricum]
MLCMECWTTTKDSKLLCYSNEQSLKAGQIQSLLRNYKSWQSTGNNAQRFPRLVPVATSKRSVATYSNDVAPLTSLPSRNITTQPDASTGTLTRIDHSSRLPIQTQQLFAKYQSQLQRNTSRNITNDGVSSPALPK